jgi:hypothetical protein
MQPGRVIWMQCEEVLKLAFKPYQGNIRVQDVIRQPHHSYRMVVLKHAVRVSIANQKSI